MIFDKLKKLDIVFDSPELDCPPVFSNGDVVSGRVVLELSAQSRVDSLKLHAEGFAKVHWTESRSAGSSTAYTQNYSDEVEYLNRREVLLQAGQSAARSGDGGWGGGEARVGVRSAGLGAPSAESSCEGTICDGKLGGGALRAVVCVPTAEGSSCSCDAGARGRRPGVERGGVNSLFAPRNSLTT